MADSRDGLPIGTPRKDPEDWTSEWFYIEDVPLSDPVRMGLPEHSSAPLKKRFNWWPKNPSQLDSEEVHLLATKIRLLAHSKLTMIEVMAVAITRCVQPLQQRGHPLWCYNGTSDATRYKRQGPHDKAAMAKILVDLFKGEVEDFAQLSIREGCSGYNPAD